VFALAEGLSPDLLPRDAESQYLPEPPEKGFEFRQVPASATKSVAFIR